MYWFVNEVTKRTRKTQYWATRMCVFIMEMISLYIVCHLICFHLLKLRSFRWRLGPFVMMSASCFIDFWIIYRRSRQNVFIDFAIWVYLSACEYKKGIDWALVLCIVVFLWDRSCQAVCCASDQGYSFLFVTDEQFSKCTDNQANTKTSPTPWSAAEANKVKKQKGTNWQQNNE